MSSLSERISEVFGGLGTSGPVWQPSEQQVFRGGESTIESSEDEEQEGQQLATADIGELLESHDQCGNPVLDLSAQYCRALDREDEFDANDSIADAIDNDDRPQRNTQVLPNNAYEPHGDTDDEDGGVQIGQPFRGIALARGSSDVSPLKYPASGDPPFVRTCGQTNSENTGQEADRSYSTAAGRPDGQTVAAATDAVERRGINSGSPAQLSPCTNEDKKRVRFAVYQPVQRRASVDSGTQPLMQTSSGLKPARPSIKGQTGSVTKRQSSSIVPEHVAHPERFDCYELDSQLIVGGGDRQPTAQDGSMVNIVDVTDMDAKDSIQPAAPPLSTPALPQFGAGIVFRPRQKEPSEAASLMSDGDAASRSYSSAPSAVPVAEQLLADEETSLHDGDDMGSPPDGMMGPSALQGIAPGRSVRQRNYRKAAH